MASKRKSVQAAACAGEDSTGLSWRERIFIREYIDSGNNATQSYLKAWREEKPSYGTASEMGSRLLRKVEIQEGLKAEFERRRKFLDIDRDKVLRTYAGMAFAMLDDFAEVFSDPALRENYDGLDDLRAAIKSGKKTVKYDEDGNETVTTEIQLVDRKAALDALWEKLGLGKEGSGRGWADRIDVVRAALERVASRKKE